LEVVPLPASENASHAPRVLVIEDDTHLLRALSYFLRQRGMVVDEATDGDKGLARFFAAKPDVVVIDNSLPGRMGYEVCRELRATDAGLRTPIIMVSAFMKVLGLDQETTSDNGDLVDGFLRKPFQLEQLWETIEDLRVGDTFRRSSSKSLKQRVPSVRTASNNRPDDSIPRRGECKDTPFVELLAKALAHQSTGILGLREGKCVRRLYFANGFPVFARSNLIRENLLRYLYQANLIDAETYRKHLVKMQQERWRPGATLVREGVISLTRLNKTHQLLVERILRECLTWHNATFEFVTSQAPVEQAVVHTVNTFQLPDPLLGPNVKPATPANRPMTIFNAHIQHSLQSAPSRHILD